MPFLVEQIIEGKASPVTVRRDDPVNVALDRMVENDFSQLPVVDEEGHPLGMVTHEGILRGIRSFNTNIWELHVRDVIESAPEFNLEDDIFELLEQLKQKNAVLIVDSWSFLVGIVTSFDTTEYFRNRAEHIMRVEDIETTIKESSL